MSEPFLGEIKMVGFNFAPRGWSFCDGQILPINQNQSLYSLLGTTYGGDGRTNFALPDLRGRTPFHYNSNFPLGQKSGSETHSLVINEIPSHAHSIQGTSAAQNTTIPSSINYLADSAPAMFYGSPANSSANPLMVGATGGGQSHDNMQPYMVVNFCIALQGLFPSRN